MKIGNYDKKLVSVVALLLVLGLVVLSSASVVLSYNNFGENFYYLKHQFFNGMVPGLLVMAILSKVDYRNFRKYAPFFLIVTLALLVSVFIPALTYETKGASRWIIIAGMSIQPSELAKVAFIIYLAAWLEQRKKKINDPNEAFFPFLMILVLIAIPILKQPDLGTLIVISGVSFAMYFVAGAGFTYISIMIVGGIIGVLALIKIAPYRMNRLTVFLHPELDPQGIGYQINQSLLAIGSGGLLGLGLGHSRQKFNYLPEPMGDSIFAIIGEELGIWGTVLIIVLFVVFAQRGFKIASEAKDDFGKFMAVGITSWIILQAIMNIGAITSLIPLTGIPLPFISYGGSSLLATLTGVGILLSISRFGNSFNKK